MSRLWRSNDAVVLSEVTVIKLAIVHDISRGSARASLNSLRIC